MKNTKFIVNLKKNIFNFLAIVFIFHSCTKAPDEIDVTVDAAKNGMIQGKVLYQTIVDNSLGYKGLKGATVEILDTDFTVTTSDNGVYAIDGIPTGSYTVRASWTDRQEYETTTESVVVTRQSTSIVPDIKMEAGYKRYIVYGRAYFQDKTTPFSNKKIYINDRGSRVGETTTSDNGNYGFDLEGGGINYDLAYIVDGKQYGFSLSSSINSYPHGVIEIDAYYSMSK